MSAPAGTTGCHETKYIKEIMNVRKNIDYSGLYAGIDKALSAGLSQMELYLELGGW